MTVPSTSTGGLRKLHLVEKLAAEIKEGKPPIQRFDRSRKGYSVSIPYNHSRENPS